MLNFIKVLGASGSRTKGANTTSFQIYNNIIIDAGNVINVLDDDTKYLEHVFLTHSHIDHISDLPFIIESFYEKRTKPLTIYGSKETIGILKKYTFNDIIWPDFSKINLINSNEKSLIFKEISINETIKIDNYEIKAISAIHNAGSFGYLVSKEKNSYLISGDTYYNEDFWEIIEENKQIKAILLECSFPNKMQELSKTTMHLNPLLIKKGLESIKRDDFSIFLYHLKPSFVKEIVEDIDESKILDYGGKILKEGDVIHIDSGKIESNLISEDKFQEIMKINLAFSSETNKDKLFEKILLLTRKLTSADAGTLYIRSEDENKLQFKTIQNSSMNINTRENDKTLKWNDLPIYLENGETNNNMVAVVSALEKRVINIEDVYETSDYSFKGTKSFDHKTGYRSKSMLVIPLINYEDEVIGVLQLINKTESNKITKFNKTDEKILKSLASQAAMALTNTQLIDGLENFINAFVSTIAKAVDAKSPHTRDHIGKVEKVAILIAKAINEDKELYKNISYSENDYKQIALAAWIHDIGKISMPEHVLDKATKLEKIFDRIELIEQRFEIIKNEQEIKYLKKQISEEEYLSSIKNVNSNLLFIKKINIGSEFMHEEDIKRLNEISKLEYHKGNETFPLLTEDEIYNLSIKKGTLTPEEIAIIKGHASLSLEMISNLPFPKRYKDVLHIACNHHEKLNGAGYPRGLTEEEICLEDRIMILADIFEALTTSGRPYKKAMKLSNVYKILKEMAARNELDENLIEFFFNHENFNEFTKKELHKDQLDLIK